MEVDKALHDDDAPLTAAGESKAPGACCMYSCSRQIIQPRIATVTAGHGPSWFIIHNWLIQYDLGLAILMDCLQEVQKMEALQASAAAVCI